MNDLPDDPIPVRSSRWRLAVLVAVLIGGGFYLLAQFAAADDAGRFPSMAVIITIMLSPMLALLGFAGWWVLLGDGRWYYRIFGIFGCGIALAAAIVIAHPSIRTFAIMWGIPLSVGITGLVLAVTPSLRLRRLLGVIVSVLAITPWLLLRMDGVTSQYVPDTSFRWKPSIGDLADAQLADHATSTPTEPVSIAQNSSFSSEDWPGFRGSLRTGDVSASAVQGWNGSQPRELWRHKDGKVGPAWSSFCVVGEVFFTQEQRGKSESVVCYSADTGAELWARGETSYHYDQPSEAGPRATPTYANGMIYAVSATGIVSCLRASTGEPVWVVNLTERFEATKPMYGFSTSPLVVGELVIINPASTAAPRLVALEAATGKTRWSTEARGTDGYSSPHPATIHGVDQVLVFNGNGLYGHEPTSGRELWHYDWKVATTEPTTIQPLVLPDGRIVIGGGNIGLGIRCAAIRKEGDTWTATEAWKTTEFTPRFNDVVRFGDYLYGLDGGILSCINLGNGKRMWKEGRYGGGQLLLVGDKLLIVSEDGQLACVAAKPDDYEELWKMKAISGKTWNHPTIAHGRLFVRNRSEMVVFELPGVPGETTGSPAPSQK
jgi:outer membrane protein assembly factor BamB